MKEPPSREEGDRAVPVRPVPWYTRAAEAIGIKSHGDLNTGQGFRQREQQPDPLKGVVVCFTQGPVYLSRSETDELKKYLENVLYEVKSVIGSSAEEEYECEDEYCSSSVSPVIQEPFAGAGLKQLATIVIGVATLKRPGGLLKLREVIFPGYASERPQSTLPQCTPQTSGMEMKKDSENVKYVEVIEKITQDIKAVINDGVKANQIAPDSARELGFIIDQLNSNISRGLSENGSRLFTLDGLKKIVQLPDDFSSLRDKIKGFGSAIRSVANIAGAFYRVTQSVGPGIFQNVGKEALDLILDHFHLQKYDLNADPKFSLICGPEFTSNQNLLRKVMLNMKSDSFSMCLKASDIDPDLDIQVNAPEHVAAGNENDELKDPNCAEFYVEKLLGYDMNAMLYLPFSLGKSKVELQCMHPFNGFAGSIGLNSNRMPCLSVSNLWGLQDLGLCGVDSFGVGGQVKINDANAWVNCSAGLSVRAQLCNFGFTFKQPGLFSYTLFSNILNTSTVVGGLASYSYVSDQWKLTGGVAHSFNPSLHVKARIESDKVASAVISKKFIGKGSLNFVSEIDFKEFWKIPRAGVFFSLP